MNAFFYKVQTAVQTHYFRDWVIASVGGVLLSSLAIPIAMGSLTEEAIAKISNTAYLLIYLLLGGVILGACQWIVLKKTFRRAYGWIVATALGAMFAEIAMIVLVAPLFDFLADPSIWRIAPIFRQAATSALTFRVVYGLTVGFAQWLFLRRRVQRAELWIAAVVLVQLLIFGVDIILPHPDFISLATVDNSRRLIFVLGQFLRTVITGLIWGAITGILLVNYESHLEAARPIEDTSRNQ